MNDTVLSPRQKLDGEIEDCRRNLATLRGKTQAEIEAARVANNTALRDKLLDFNTDLTEAILVYNRSQIAVLDADLPPLNDQLRQLNKSMKDRMAKNKKIAQQLSDFA